MPPDPAHEERIEQLREKVELAREFFDLSPNNKEGFRCLGEAGRLLAMLGYRQEAEWFDANDIGLGAANDIRLEALTTVDRILVELDSPNRPLPTQPPPTIPASPSQTTVDIAGPVASVQNAPGSTANISQKIENPTPGNLPQSATVKAAYITAAAVIVAGIGAALITRDPSSKYPERPTQPAAVSHTPAPTRTARPSPRTPVPTACFETITERGTKRYSINKPDWKNQGGDGHGGTLVSYDLTAPARIDDVTLTSCHGCGGHFWLCNVQEPRCKRPLIEPLNDTTWRVWAATDDSSATTTVFLVQYLTPKRVEAACPPRSTDRTLN